MNNDLLTYNALDCACTIEARNAFWSEINTHGYQPAYDMTLRLFNPLMFMMTRGIRVNFEALEETKVDITNKEKQAQEELNRIAGRELNALSPKECQLYFYVEKGIPPYYSKNGGVTTDDKALQRIARGTAKRAGLREAKLVQDIRGYRKLFGTYLDIDFDSDGRLRCAYNPRGCLLPETEVLTKTGWVTLQDFTQGSEALQWSPNGDLTWGIPKKVIYDCDEILIECQSEQHRCVYTNDHRIPSYQPNTDKLEVRTAKDTAKTYRQLPVSGKLTYGKNHMPGMAKIIAMIQADGCIAAGNIILNLKKQRKIQRCRELLDLYQIAYTLPGCNEGYTRFFIRSSSAKPFIDLLGKDKLFGAWMLDWNIETIKTFLDELQHWDGSVDTGRSVCRYVTKQKTNATWVATLAHICNKSAYTTKIFEGQDRNPLWRVSIKENVRVSLKSPYWKPYSYKGKVYCLETDTEYFLAKYEDHIFITGNTKFGRLSSSATVFRTGTNLQNLPAEFKKFLVPDPGYFFWEIDKRQAEWVVVAYLSGDANMLHVIETGEDPHTHTAHLMFRVPKEAIRIDHKLIGNLNDPDEIEHRRRNHPDLLAYIDVLPRMMSARQMGKKSNHGLNYDEGYRTFSLTNEIEEAEGKRIVTLYHSIYPGIRANYYESVKRQLTKDRTLTNCFGRKIRFLDAWGDSLFKAAYSAIPQSTVVDGLNIGMCEIYEDAGLTDQTGYNIDILAQVHDSILMQVPLSILDQGDTFWNIAQSVYNKVSPEMEYNGRKFKIATDSKVGMNWGGYHPEVNSSGMQEVEVGNHPASFVSKVKRITNVEQGA